MDPVDKLILVAEDEEDIRELIVGQLEGSGYTVVSAADGQSALRVAAQTYPDLAVLDIGMPRIDGLELAKRFREHRVMRKMGLIALTARGSEQDVITGFESGFDDYLQKPFRPRELSARVEAVLARL
ncbi:MAG: two-component system, OmpR family, alkaline phosphatase synthesis response regulator PhoP [Thermoleophilaceae bacterium]|jgi:DNA-binding response OmpR family regulator|nr:two-component system, OmpR family, alkaline phosphatase synthesis response regulator PhoP [Thermoleophilaceae bacterium]